VQVYVKLYSELVPRKYQQAKETGEKTPSVSFFALGKAFVKL